MAKRNPKAAKRVRKARPIPKGQRIDVTRAEFDRVIDILNERGEILNDLRHNQDIQFQRIAQLQHELDQLKRAWERMRVPA